MREMFLGSKRAIRNSSKYIIPISLAVYERLRLNGRNIKV